MLRGCLLLACASCGRIGFATIGATGSGSIPCAGTTGFAAEATYATGTAPAAVAIGDLDGDGLGDLAVADFTVPGTVSVLLARKQFAHTEYDVGGKPLGVAIGRVIGGPSPDLSLALNDQSLVATLEAIGNGAFGVEDLTSTPSLPRAVVATDLDGNGTIDLAVSAAGPPAGVMVALFDGAGGRSAPKDYPVDVSPRAIAAGDVNGDGHIDLATATSTNSTISILLGNGDGTYQPFTTASTGALFLDPWGVAIADLDGDGKLDLVTANNTAFNLALLRGNGDGTFRASEKIASCTRADSLVVVDLNGDGTPDVAAACPNDNAVRVLFGHGDGTFAAPVDLPSTAPAAITAGDVDGDGRIDLAVVHGTADQVGVFVNRCAP